MKLPIYPHPEAFQHAAARKYRVPLCGQTIQEGVDGVSEPAGCCAITPQSKLNSQRDKFRDSGNDFLDRHRRSPDVSSSIRQLVIETTLRDRARYDSESWHRG